MAYVNHNRILTIASGPINTAVCNVTIFSPVEPTTRENGGDLLNGDRWINTEALTESVWYYGEWLKLNNILIDGNLDGGGSGPEPENPIIIDGGSSLPHPAGTLTFDGGSATSNLPQGPVIIDGGNSLNN